MDISNVTRNYINKRVDQAKRNLDEKSYNECTQGLQNADSNGDGKTTGIDMYNSWSNTCKNVFAGNETFLARGEEISQQQGEIYSLYAGEDGVLDEYEYNAALQSDEMGVLIDEYWEMRNLVETEKGNINDGILLSHYDANRDGNLSSLEVFKSKTEIYEKKYNDDTVKQEKALEIAHKQSEILNQFEGEDGYLSAEEFSQAVLSSEYQETVKEFYELDN